MSGVPLFPLPVFYSRAARNEEFYLPKRWQLKSHRHSSSRYFGQTPIGSLLVYLRSFESFGSFSSIMQLDANTKLLIYDPKLHKNSTTASHTHENNIVTLKI